MFRYRLRMVRETWTRWAAAAAWWRGRWSTSSPPPPAASTTPAQSSSWSPPPTTTCPTWVSKELPYRTVLKLGLRSYLCLCSGSMKFFGTDPDLDPRIRYVRQMDPDPDPAMSVSDLLDVNKKLIFFLSYFDYYFSKVHLHRFSKIKSHKELAKQ